MPDSTSLPVQPSPYTIEARIHETIDLIRSRLHTAHDNFTDCHDAERWPTDKHRFHQRLLHDLILTNQILINSHQIP